MRTTDVRGLPLILTPFRPITRGWVEWPTDLSVFPGSKPYVLERYYNRGQELQVMTSIEVVEQDDHSPPRPEYHLSVSGLKHLAALPHRVCESTARWALKQFGFDGFTEDNHAPHGLVRNYWRPVADQFAGQVCACVKDEPTIKEMQGDYVWRG
jgi:hypothetical protein